MTNKYIPVDITEANAHLIAAAPEMLEMLEQIYSNHIHDDKAVYIDEEIYLDNLEKLIKKAKEGRS